MATGGDVVEEHVGGDTAAKGLEAETMQSRRDRRPRQRGWRNPRLKFRAVILKAKPEAPAMPPTMPEATLLYHVANEV